MKVAMIGTGYVGLVTGTCFAESGNDVTCVDIDEAKVNALREGQVPIYEPGLTELVHRNRKVGRLKFSTNYAESIPGARCVFICVGTPQDDDGSANLQYVQQACFDMGPHLDEGTIVVVKSTVPVGTNRKVATWLTESTGRVVDTASNPEFLKEGAAIDDFTKPDRVVVGAAKQEVADTLHDLYRPFLRTENPYLVMNIESAEMTKYVANCMLATKISFINEMANLCERVGANINDVRRGIGHDARIGFSFLFPGVGYGGSCFPKDVRALVAVAKSNGLEARVLRSVDEVNNQQKGVLFEKLKCRFGEALSGSTIALWGLSFKPRTDDIREAPALVLIDSLLEVGATINVHDPVAIENVRREYGDRLNYFDHHYDACTDADALCVMTEWKEFSAPDFEYLKFKMKQPVIFDGRNVYDPKRVRKLGFYYSGIGLHEDVA
ncbi:MAG: UDP-glucose/GDP-mannose dehydrogenase family protein [Planctomycetota bacterium]|nr:UDP-glucose/GDP-mannose dehydrogenase family protein [Planctomycetota bacterium]